MEWDPSGIWLPTFHEATSTRRVRPASCCNPGWAAGRLSRRSSPQLNHRFVIVNCWVMKHLDRLVLSRMLVLIYTRWQNRLLVNHLIVNCWAGGDPSQEVLESSCPGRTMPCAHECLDAEGSAVLMSSKGDNNITWACYMRVSSPIYPIDSVLLVREFWVG